VHYITANPNGEAQVVEVKLSQSSTARKKVFEYDFSELEIKGRGARGNTITKYPVRKVDLLESKGSTLSGLDLWFDEASGRLNKDKRGKPVGKFDGADQILSITRSGNYKITGFDLTTRFEPEKTVFIEKFNPRKVISAVYYDGESKQYFVKRFLIETNTIDKEFNFISEGIGSRLEFVSSADSPEVLIEVVKGKDKKTETVALDDIIDVKGWKALGNRLSQHRVTKVTPVVEPDESGTDNDDDEAPSAKASETRSSPPPKKKSASSEVKQASLFEEAKREKGQKGKAQVGKGNRSTKTGAKQDSSGKTFKPGQTIELDL
jgi:topoisomerase-4 subunit A